MLTDGTPITARKITNLEELTPSDRAFLRPLIGVTRLSEKCGCDRRVFYRLIRGRVEHMPDGRPALIGKRLTRALLRRINKIFAVIAETGTFKPFPPRTRKRRKAR